MRETNLVGSFLMDDLKENLCDENAGTFRYQSSLCRLPVPLLNESGEKFLDWIEPLVDKHTYEKTCKTVLNFIRPGGDGEKLQARLEEWASGDASDCWLEPLWFDNYLSCRLPLAVHVNPFYVMEHNIRMNGISRSELAASLILTVLQFKRCLDRENLKVEYEGNKPLCMDQYRNIFSSCRIPGKKKDLLKKTNMAEQGAIRHIVVFCGNRVFKVNVISEDGTVVSGYSFKKSIDTILSYGDVELEDHECVGVLTTLPRDEWADAREHLLGLGGMNAQNLNIIESSLFVLCLDKQSFSGSEEVARGMLHGKGRNRWYDKPFQFILSSAGRIGVNMEHSATDGSVVSTMIKYIYDNMSPLPGNDMIDPDFEDPIELHFRLDVYLKDIIQDACRRFDNLVSGTVVRVVEFPNFGKERIKSFKVSPDAFVQLAFQIAQYNLLGRFASIYQPVMMRQYYHGRTEAMRPVTKDSELFVKCFVERKIERDQLIDLLKKASVKHVSRIRECRAGKGIQRHLWGLKKMYDLYGEDLGIRKIPDFFVNDGWQILTHDTFSTSTTRADGLFLAGFGPVVQDGFALRYLMKKDRINFFFSGWEKNGYQLEKLPDLVQKALIDMAELMKL